MFTLLAVSYDRLQADHRRLGRILARNLWASSFDLQRAADVSGLPLDVTERFVDILLDNNLIRQYARGWFDLHALVSTSLTSPNEDRDLHPA